jgi:sorbose reductase
MVSLAYTAVYALRNIDRLLCFAGVVGCVHSMNVTAPDFQKMIDVNLTGSFLYAQAAACLMMPNEGGRILFVSPILGQATNFPQPQAAYNVSKASVLHMTRRNLGAVHGIRVNAISPGYMDTMSKT